MKTFFILLCSLACLQGAELKELAFKVRDVSTEGCRVECSWTIGEPDVFIYGFAGYSDQTYRAYVKPHGSYTYKTVMGAMRMIPAYEVATTNEIALQKAEFDAAVQAADRKYSERKEAEFREKLKKDEKQRQVVLTNKIAIDQKTFEFRKKKALEGSAEFQYELGKMYLNGSPAVPADYTQAIFWLKKSAEQGNTGAQKLLSPSHEK